MRRMLAVAAAVALVAAVEAGAARAAEVLDQQQTDGTGEASSIQAIHYKFYEAQTFTAGRTGQLTRADLMLWRDALPEYPMHVEVRTLDPSGEPSDTVLATTTLSPADVPTAPAFVAVSFSPGAPVQAGTRYALVGTPSQVQFDAEYLWQSSPGDSYASGERWAWNGARLEWTSHPVDQAFRTYVTPSDTTAPVSTATASPGPLAAGHPLTSVTATATFKTTAGTTAGTVGPVNCWNTRGLKVSFDATDDGTGVRSLTYSATGAQPIAPTTVSTLPATVSITASGVTKLTYSAIDNADNQEAEHSETVLVAGGFACATPTPSRFAIPAHGSATVTGKAVVGRYTIPFATTIRY